MRTSPFNKQDSDKNVHFLVKKTKEAASNAHYAVTSIFPNSGDVPHSIRLCSALFYLVSVAVVFTYLLWTGYEATLHTEFLAPYLGNHAFPNRNCDLIPISYTGSFLISDDGYWEGAKDFSYSSSTYSFSVVAYSATDETFKDDMSNIHSGLLEAGAIAATQPLFANLILWMSLAFVNSSSNGAHRFTLTGDPLVIFNRDYIDASVSSIKGNCNVTSTSSFDTSSGHMTISWKYKDFIAEPLCLATMDPILMGYDAMTGREMFTIQYDIRTLIMGLAVNLRVVKTEQLEEIKSYASNVISNGLSIAINYYYDPRFAEMDPIRCARVGGGLPICFVSMNEVQCLTFYLLLFLFPLFIRW
jgi:hypothetical protein